MWCKAVVEVFFLTERLSLSAGIYLYIYTCAFSAPLSYSQTITITTHTQTPLTTHTHMQRYRVETDPKVIQSVLVSLERLISQNVSCAGSLRALGIRLHISVPPCWIPCITHTCCSIAAACVCLVNNTSDILLPLLFWTVQCRTLNEQEDKFPNYAFYHLLWIIFSWIWIRRQNQ